MKNAYTLTEIENSSFFAVLDEKDNMQMIQMMSKNMPSDDWQSFGYLYLGPLAYAGNIQCDLKKNSCSSEWIQIVLNAICESNNNVYALVIAGVDAFVRDAHQNEISITKDTVSAIINYIEKKMHGKYQTMLLSLRIPDKDGKMMPITPHGKYRFGIINPWPGAKSAESEVITRTMVAAEDAGLDCVPLSNFGQILDRETQKATDEFVKPEDLDFVITTHYDSPKILDNFHYHTLWNPPEIPLNLGDYATRVTGNYLANEDFLIYDAGGMSNHLRCILMNKPRTLDDASSLTASFPESKMLVPNLDDPKMFYCGMNWETVVHNSSRHQGLFKLLDDTGNVKFFGPDVVKEWGGIRPWAGYKCYQYSIPFDGFSILNEINKCGICLVLSSDIHRRAGAATNRTYEACAAGAVIISDDNPFMLKYFKDAALFITYNKKDPEDTFRQLMEKYEWIVSHKKEALELAKKAQDIFRKYFTMDRQLKAIVENHPKRVETIYRDLYAQDDSKLVAVGFVLSATDFENAKEKLQIVLDNIQRQYYSNVELLIAADQSVAAEVEEYCKSQFFATKVFSMELFDSKKSRFLTNCEALEKMYEQVDHDLFINTSEYEKWFSDHVTTLVRTMKDENCEVVYSARAQMCPDGLTRPEFFDSLHQKASIIDMVYPNWIPGPGQVMFDKKCHSYILPFMRPFLDGCEHYAMIAASWMLHDHVPQFSKRMSFQYYTFNDKMDGLYTVVSQTYQQRLINDMLHYAAESSFAGSNVIINNNTEVVDDRKLMKDIAYLPTKKWIKMKRYRVMLRYVHSGRIYTKIKEKYDKLEESFINHFNQDR